MFVTFLVISLKIIFVLTNIEDPDEMLHYAAFHLGLLCLLGVTSTCIQMIK